MRYQIQKHRSAISMVPLIAVFLVLSILCNVSVEPVKAYVLQEGSLISGIYNRTYTFLGPYSTHSMCLDDSIADWNWVLNSANDGSGVDFYFTKTSSENATIRVTEINDAREEYTGLATYYITALGEDHKVENTNNRTFSIIIFNNAYAPRADLLAGELTGRPFNYMDEMTKIFSHEIGHAIGLRHSSDLGNAIDYGTLMYPYWNKRTAYSPTLDEVNGVRAKYG